MTIIIILFFIAIGLTFSIIYFRAWEVKNSKVAEPIILRKIVPEIYFRQTEKIMLYLTKHIVQSLILISAKYWFIFLTKLKKWSLKKLPKIYKFFKIKTKEINQQKNTFLSKAILESKIKIQRIKEKVRRDHENQ